MPQLLLVLGIVLSASLTIAAHYTQPPRRWLVYIFKPLTTILILLIALWPQTFLREPYAGAIALGLLFSLAGDIWLMLPGNYFLAGLISFLIAHVCYIFAFASQPLPFNALWPFIPLAIFGVIFLRYLWPALAEMKWPVMIYLTVIVGMTALAVSGGAAWRTPSALLAAVGALFFMASDAVLAVERFRQPFRWAKAVVLSTYFLGQTLIALSVN